MLILDDCFSSVDTETEEHILRRLRAARRGMTTILVSHRVSTARHADRIVVLDDGAIAEIGSHDELIARDGWYAELERTQRRRGRLLSELREARGGASHERAATRDYAVFDAELAGKSFNARLIGRLFVWVRPHWRQALLSGVLVLVASVLAILMPVIVSRVVIDGLLQDQPGSVLPDFGMNALNELVSALSPALPHLFAGVRAVHDRHDRPGRSRRTTTASISRSRCSARCATCATTCFRISKRGPRRSTTTSRSAA